MWLKFHKILAIFDWIMPLFRLRQFSHKEHCVPRYLHGQAYVGGIVFHKNTLLLSISVGFIPSKLYDYCDGFDFGIGFSLNMGFEPRHDKTNRMSVRPAKTQISMDIGPVWSESSLCAQWVAKDPSFLHAESEDSDQIGRMPRLIWVFAGRTLILVVLSCRGSFTFESRCVTPCLWHEIACFFFFLFFVVVFFCCFLIPETCDLFFVCFFFFFCFFI